MSVKAKVRLVFLAMFLGMFACGTLGGRICIWLGIPSLTVRNILAVLCSYFCFLGMMWLYVRVIRTDPVFLRSVAAEGPDDGGKKSSSGGWFNWGDWGGDLDGLFLLFVVLVLIVLVGAWIGMEGPALLIDEASAAAIAAGLTGRAVFRPDESWLLRVVRRTVLPISLYLLLTSIVMGYADFHCPGRLKLTQVVKECVMGDGGR